MRRLGLALSSAWLFLSSHAFAVETDIRGWDKLTWGMTAQQVDAALPQAVPLSPPWDFGPLYAERMVRDVVVGGIAFAALTSLTRPAAVTAETEPVMSGESA